ncbi:SPOR domain-containing protein [Ectothiorhodospiraceae bacterium 2226]|nr:SPOR domain-containing protein [Ectothiorhodospiraceae bacterium 2226]
MDDERLRQRLIGATIILALAVVFLPMVLRGPETEAPDPRAAQDDGPARIIQLSEAEERERQRWMVVPERKQATAEAPAKPQSDAAAPTQPAEAPSEPAAEAPAKAQAPSPSTRPAEAPPSRPAQVPAKDEVPTQAGFVVQMGSFSVRRNADGLSDRLQANGYDAFVETLETPRGPVYRVRVGPSETRAQADTLREALHTELGMQGLVLRHP